MGPRCSVAGCGCIQGTTQQIDDAGPCDTGAMLWPQLAPVHYRAGKELYKEFNL